MDNPISNIHQTIDYHSNIPYYVQLIGLMKKLIGEKVWRPGTKLPGEMDLCDEYGVSRTVVRQALRELEINGLVTRRKGKGTFVAEPKINESLAQRLTGFYQDMVERGLKPVTRVLHQRVVPCDDKVAGYLQIQPGTQVIDISRLRSVEDAPIQLVNSYIPYALCPKLANVDLTNRSLYEFLENECGLFISHGRRFIEAVAANEQETKLLQVERGAPMILLDSISYLEDGRPIEYYHALHRGDRTRFEVELVRYRKAEDDRSGDFIKADDLPNSNPLIREPNSQ
jgi:GntR family transcriptional regulator